MEVKRLSWSQINMLSRCGQQYIFRYVEHIKMPPKIAWLVGSATHKAVEVNLQHKIDTDGELLPVEQVKEIAYEDFNRRWERGEVRLTDVEADRNLSDVKGDATDKSVGLSALHASELAPHLNPVSVEREWSIRLEKLGVDMVGRMDIEEPGGIRETKTSGKAPNKLMAANSDQLTLYGLVFKSINGQWPIYLNVDCLYQTPKKKECKQVVLTSEREEQDYYVLYNRVQRVVECVQREVFIPASRDSWQCSPMYCGYFDMCPFTK